MFSSGKKLKADDPLYKWAFGVTPGKDVQTLVENLRKLTTWKRYFGKSIVGQGLRLNIIDNDISNESSASSGSSSGSAIIIEPLSSFSTSGDSTT